VSEVRWIEFAFSDIPLGPLSNSGTGRYRRRLLMLGELTGELWPTNDDDVPIEEGLPRDGISLRRACAATCTFTGHHSLRLQITRRCSWDAVAHLLRSRNTNNFDYSHGRHAPRRPRVSSHPQRSRANGFKSWPQATQPRDPTKKPIESGSKTSLQTRRQVYQQVAEVGTRWITVGGRQRRQAGAHMARMQNRTSRKHPGPPEQALGTLAIRPLHSHFVRCTYNRPTSCTASARSSCRRPLGFAHFCSVYPIPLADDHVCLDPARLSIRHNSLRHPAQAVCRRRLARPSHFIPHHTASPAWPGSVKHHRDNPLLPPSDRKALKHSHQGLHYLASAKRQVRQERQSVSVRGHAK